MKIFSYTLASICTRALSSLALLGSLPVFAGIPSGYRLETVPTPPGAATLLGICHKDEKTVAVTTWEGEVWELQGGAWKQFAEGMMDPLGIRYDAGEDSYHVAQKPELTRLRDSDGDGRADLLATETSAFGYSDDYHEYHYGPVVDSLGRQYGVLNLGAEKGPHVRGDHRAGPDWSYMKYSAPWRGWVYRSDRAGHFHPFACGFRSPAGIGMSPKDELFITDNQGDWMPVCGMFFVREGSFYGHPSGLGGHPAFGVQSLEKIRAEDFADLRRQPAIWFPYNIISRSPGSPVWDTTGGKFGPFDGQIFVGDQSMSNVFRCGLEWIGEDYQGWCINFADHTDSGPVNMAFDADGRLWIAQVGRGWNSKGGNRTALQKLAWDGKTVPFEIHSVSLTPKGFRLNFTRPLGDGQDLAAVLPQLQSWKYKYWAKYGSDPVEKRSHRVSSHSLSEDRRTLEIETSLAAGRVYEITCVGLKSEDGSELINHSAFYTANTLRPANEPPAIGKPLMAGSSWRRNDNGRPRPPVVEPLAQEQAQVAVPDSAILLGPEAWNNPNWKFLEDGSFYRAEGNLATRENFGSARFHVEFKFDPSDDPAERGQLYGNSGVWLMSRYEVQVMNSFGNDTCADGQCGAFWGQVPPRVNSSRPPGQWQSYDILMKAPEFAEDGSLIAPTRATVYHNGVLIHDDESFLGETTRGYQQHGKGPFMLQAHAGSPVAFRNAWAVADVDYDAELPAFRELFGANNPDRPVARAWENRAPVSILGAGMVAQMDADKDARVTRDEFLGFWMGRFDPQDKDGSGHLDGTEFPAAEALKGADGNKDGLLTRDEYRRVYAPQFDGLDTDDDDVITGRDRR
jgi:hypothetical protein